MATKKTKEELAEYQRELRRKKPELLKRDHFRNKVRNRALSRLARKHPNEYLDILYEEEIKALRELKYDSGSLSKGEILDPPS